MSEDQIKAALSISVEYNANICGTSSYIVKLMWNDEEISCDEVEIYD